MQKGFFWTGQISFYLTFRHFADRGGLLFVILNKGVKQVEYSQIARGRQMAEFNVSLKTQKREEVNAGVSRP